jgi:hypothetical protein
MIVWVWPVYQVRVLYKTYQYKKIAAYLELSVSSVHQQYYSYVEDGRFDVVVTGKTAFSLSGFVE